MTHSAEPYDEILARIQNALLLATKTLHRLDAPTTGYKNDGEPITEADRAVNEVLKRDLPRDGDGWLSEESVDDHVRLERRRVWVVDPLDGTKEFIAGIPEWAVSIALVEDQQPVAGGILNPATRELFIGAIGAGVWYNGRRVRVSERTTLNEATVLASRSEVERGEWTRFRGAPFRIQAMGSVAYKLARVAAGLADATWTLVPKNEWDVAAGTALVLAAGGVVYSREGDSILFNQPNPLLQSLIAHPTCLSHQVAEQFKQISS